VKAPLVVAVSLVLTALANPGVTRAQERACGSSDPVNTVKEVLFAIYACWEPPPGTAGMSITLQFSLRRQGTLIGKPRATYSNLGGGEALNRAFVASILQALKKALPLPLSDSLGGRIAGRTLAPRFTATRGDGREPGHSKPGSPSILLSPNHGIGLD
jgi:hypothetical protein